MLTRAITITTGSHLQISCRKLASVRKGQGRQASESFFHSTSSLQESDVVNVDVMPGRLAWIQDQMRPTAQKSSDDLFRHATHPKTVSIIGVPMTYGQPFHGTDSSPRLLRQGGLRSMLTALDWRVEDIGDMTIDSSKSSKSQFLSNAKNSCIVGPATAQLADLVESKIKNGYFPLTLGGDHSIGIGSLSGILRARPEVGVLWIDAHADLNTPETSGSGNLHGMPVGLLMEGMEIDFKKYPGLEWLQGGPRLKPDSIVYVGLRDVDLSEAEAIRNLGITAYTMHDIDRYGIGAVMDMAMNHLLKNNPDRQLHLSYDIDVIDPIHAPATGTTVRGGLTFREAHFVAEFVAQNGNLASAEMVELNHTLSDGDGAKKTMDLGLHIVTSLMGKSII